MTKNNYPQNLITPRNLIEFIFDSEAPELIVQEIPAQQLYMAVKHRGVSSSGDLIAIASVEQCRIMLDFDVWEKDEFQENNFFEWLAIADSEGDLELVKKVIVSSDLKLVARLLQKYVIVTILEDPTDMPPGEGAYTPDKGYTWLQLNHPNEDDQFLLGRMLAVIHDYDARLFYQLIGIPGIATPAELEEKAYEEKEKRLEAEGIPDFDWALKINTPILPVDARMLFREKTGGNVIASGAEPATFRQPEQVLEEYLLDETAREELVLIVNAAARRFEISYGDLDRMTLLVPQIKGAVLIGLEVLTRDLSIATRDLLLSGGLQAIYRRGLYELFTVRKAAERFPLELLKKSGPESRIFFLIAALKEGLPLIPDWFDVALTEDDLKEPAGEAAGMRSINTVTEISHCCSLLQALQEETHADYH